MLSHTAEPLRVVFYSHDSQGLGHFRRNRVLAHALSQRLPAHTGRSVTGLLINGVGSVAASSLPPGFDVVTLPAVGKTGPAYGARRLDLGLDTVTRLRGQIVQAALSSFRPDLIVIDRHAFGVDGELAPALELVRWQQPRAQVVLGLREVLDDPQSLAAEWQRTPPSRIRELFDRIWVYGDPQVHDLRASGELPEELHDLVDYQGYLAHGRAEEPAGLDPETPYLLTTAGGGSDGVPLCLAAARAEVPRGHRHVVVTGPQMADADHRRVEREAGPRTTVVKQVPDASGLIRRAAATVSMAGYNTVTETLATDVPVLLVPREWPRREQLIRATDLAADGSVDLLRERNLSAPALSRWMAGAVTRRCRRSHLNLAGLRSVARSAAQLTAASRAGFSGAPTEEIFVAV